MVGRSSVKTELQCLTVFLMQFSNLEIISASPNKDVVALIEESGGGKLWARDVSQWMEV